MIRHYAMIKPETGIFSNLGDAHDSGFESKTQKLKEKSCLFNDCNTIIYNRDLDEVHDLFTTSFKVNLISWGSSMDAAIQILSLEKQSNDTRCDLKYGLKTYSLLLPFKNQDLLQNCLNVITYLILDNWDEQEIQYSISTLSAISNRLEIREGLNNSLIINDSYSLDLASIQLGMDFQEQYSQDLKKVLILSDFDQQKDKNALFRKVGNLVKSHQIDQLICIGIEEKYLNIFEGIELDSFSDTNECMNQLNIESMHSSCILVKGARRFGLEVLVDKLSRQIHQTVLETDFNAIIHNLKIYKSLIADKTKVMAVIKAEAYGSGSVQMARFLESQNVDYLAVALIDEGIRIRQANCNLPIMIFNIQNKNLQALWQYDLEPEIYSLDLLKQLIDHAQHEEKDLGIHLKLESGMNRLGLVNADLDSIIPLLKDTGNLKVKSIFSHLSGSDNKAFDDYTHSQIKKFSDGYDKISLALGYRPLRHILNTGGVVRFSEYKFDMVRLGLGLYGIDETNELKNQLLRSHTLKTHVLQLKHLSKEETTGYNRSGKVNRDTTIAVLSIGYADGIMRKAGNGNWQIKIHDSYYPTIGNICMDVCMVDIGNNTTIKPGDEVIIFDQENHIEKLAHVCDTISYEILTRIAPRVKRIYIHK